MPTSRITREKETVKRMIHLYCLKKEKNHALCLECTELLQYAYARLERCPFGEKKKACKSCTIHCYKPDVRSRIQEVMRYAGPRMLFYHPVAAIKHLFNI